jgi:hypothetical protein
MAREEVGEPTPRELLLIGTWALFDTTAGVFSRKTLAFAVKHVS